MSEATETLIKEKTLDEKVDSDSKDITDSVCDIMKNNTSAVIRKMESQIPSYMQHYSDLYTAYLHFWDDLFGTCYISEKQFFDKMGINQNTLKAFDKYYSTLRKNSISQIEMSTNFLKAYVQMRISAIQSYDKYMHIMMDSYAKALSQFNTAYEKYSFR
ncbi:MAG: conserved hypothetical protein [Marine Group I thaumarchaeote]|nr:MAG: conserved hypothetical protein [Marine Group I thaumarchaeote]